MRGSRLPLQCSWGLQLVWDITWSRLADGCRRFRTTYIYHLPRAYLDCLTLEDGRPETSVTSYWIRPCNMPEQRRLRRYILLKINKKATKIAYCRRWHLIQYAENNSLRTAQYFYLYILPPAWNGPENSVEDTWFLVISRGLRTSSAFSNLPTGHNNENQHAKLNYNNTSSFLIDLF